MPGDPCLSLAADDVTVPHYGFAAKQTISRHNAAFTHVSHWCAEHGGAWPTSRHGYRVSVSGSDPGWTYLPQVTPGIPASARVPVKAAPARC